jgi:glycosidase
MPGIAENPEWYVRDEAGNVLAPNDDWTDVADLDLRQSGDAANAMKRAMRYWVEEFDIDGYRADVAELVPMDFWEDAIADLRSRSSRCLMLAEGQDPELHLAPDSIYRIRGRSITGSRTSGAGVRADRSDGLLEQDTDLPRDGLRMRFTTNHDETAWDATPIELFDGPAGARAASVIAYASPGVPLLYNGQEVGSTVELRLFEKDDIDWSENPDMHAFYVELGRFTMPRCLPRRLSDLDAGDDIFAIERTGRTSRVW